MQFPDRGDVADFVIIQHQGVEMGHLEVADVLDGLDVVVFERDGLERGKKSGGEGVEDMWEHVCVWLG